MHVTHSKNLTVLSSECLPSSKLRQPPMFTSVTPFSQTQLFKSIRSKLVKV